MIDYGKAGQGMWKKRRYQNKILGLIIFLIFLLGFLVVIYMDSYDLTLEEQRKMTYGSWHIAVFHTEKEEDTILADHATIETSCEINLAGDIVDKDGSSIGTLGLAGEDFFDIGNIDLLNGRMPQKSNEIVIEASCLTRMGYSYELGQDIALKIMPSGAENDRDVQICHFTLTGVVKNYSGYWKTDGNQMLSCFISTAYYSQFMQQGESVTHFFAVLKEEYAHDADSLKVLCKKGDFVKNDYVYTQYSDEDVSKNEGVFLQVLILCIGCSAIVLLVQNDLNQQKNNFVVMRVLGAKKSQIIQIYFRNKRNGIILCSGLGMLSGILLPYMLCVWLQKKGNGQIYFDLSWEHLILVAVVFSVGICASFAAGILRLFQIPLRGKPQQQAAIYHMPKRKKKLDGKNLFRVLNRIQYRKRILSVLLIFVSASFMFLAAYQTWEKYQSYHTYTMDYPDDYTFGLLTTYFTPEETMSEEDVDKIEKAYGVGEVKTIAVSDYCPLQISGETDPLYVKSVKGNMDTVLGKNISGDINGSFIGISANLESDYIKEIDSESFHRDRLEKDEIILYLPDYVSAGGELLQKDLDFSSKERGKNVTERKIKPGETIQVQTPKGRKTLVIAGIIYTFSKKIPVSLNPAKPYSMICNKETYQEIWGKYSPSYVTVNREETAIPYQTDVELSKVNTPLYFENNRVEREEQLHYLILNVTMTMILTVSVFLLIVFIRFGIYFSSEKQELERYRVFYQLGMEKKTILKHFINNGFTESVMGVISAGVLFFVCRCMNEAKILAGFADTIGQKNKLELIEICKRGISFTHWNFVIALAFLLVLVQFSLSVICDYWNIYHEVLKE